MLNADKYIQFFITKYFLVSKKGIVNKQGKQYNNIRNVQNI